MDERARRRRCREVRAATDGREIVALSFGSQLDGLVAADADGEPLQPALIWCDRRAGAECEAAAERIDPERLRELTGCNLDPGHIAPKIAWLAAHEPDVHARRARVRAARLVGGVAGDGRAGGRPVQRLLHGTAGPAHARVVRRGVRGVRRRPGSRSRRFGARTPCSARSSAWLREATGLSAGDAGRARRRRRDGGDARRGRGRAGRGVRRARHRRAGLRGGRRAGARPDRAWSSCTRTPTRTRGCWRTRAGCRAAPTAGSATSSAGSRRCAPRRAAPTSTSCSTRWRRARRRAPTACCGCRRWRARWRRSGTPTRAPAGSA